MIEGIGLWLPFGILRRRIAQSMIFRRPELIISVIFSNLSSTQENKCYAISSFNNRMPKNTQAVINFQTKTQTCKKAN